MRNNTRLKSRIAGTVLCVLFAFALSGCTAEERSTFSGIVKNIVSPGILSSAEDIGLSGDGTSYSFTYGGEDFYAEYAYDVWTVYNSYRITNPHDIRVICEALSEEHQIHGADMESYRTPSDMAFEWEQHNLAYKQLPDGNYWKESAKSVDLDPQDQGKTFKEIYEDRTGRKIELSDVMDKKEKVIEKLEGKSLKDILRYVKEHLE